MIRGTAVRRQHRKRLLKKMRERFSDLIDYDENWFEEYIRRRVTTPQPCSCLGCGNLRRQLGNTPQERRFYLNAEEQTVDVGNPE